ncbi:hypothetical protein ACFWB2_05200 [Streptomyces virginiae]|uniref:hypothetical protein n=1 Tax=Streptomyces virginiae TaxID=1961 RepID=UPI0036A0A8C5
MDQGIAAVWAAGIGVFGVVATAGGALWAAHKTAAAQIAGAKETAAAQIAGAREQAAAQVDAALAGVRAQLSGQRREAMWQVRREAYTSFLGQVEAVRIAVVDFGHLCDEAFAASRQSGRTIPDLDTPRDQLDEAYRNLWLRDSALRLSVDVEEAEEAEQVRLLIVQAVQDVCELADVVHIRVRFRAAQGRFQTSVDALNEGIVEWTASARLYLGAAGREA